MKALATDLCRLFNERLRWPSLPRRARVHASLNDEPAMSEAGILDIVHCSGVVYGCTQPRHPLKQLRAIRGESLILRTAAMPELLQRTAGPVSLAHAGWCFFSPAYVKALLDIARFNVVRVASYSNGRATLFRTRIKRFGP